MSAQEVAKALADLCRQGKNMEAIETYYSDHIVSVEPMDMPNLPARMEGIEAVRGKNQWWYDNHEVHAMEVKGPYVHGDQFALLFEIDVTTKAGERAQLAEVGLYTVKDGKVVHEEFFYHA